jgi:excisionase family DNA binding protein
MPELGVSAVTVRRWIAAGELRAVKLGRTRSAQSRVQRAALERFPMTSTEPTEGRDAAMTERFKTEQPLTGEELLALNEAGRLQIRPEQIQRADLKTCRARRL